MMTQQQLKANGSNGGFFSGTVMPVLMIMMLMLISGCAGSSAGWKQDAARRQTTDTSNPAVENDLAQWERPDGSMVRAEDDAQAKLKAKHMPDIGTVSAMAGNVGQPAGAYQLGAGDQVSVTIWGYEKLSRTTRIKEDGTIFAPYVGNVHLAGRTLVEAQQYLTEQYNAYIRNPQLDLDIAEYASNKLFLIGDLDIFLRSQMVTGGKAQSFSSGGQDQQQLQSSLGSLSGVYGFGGIGGSIGSGSSQSTVNNLVAGEQKSLGNPISRVVPIRGRVTLFEAMLELDVLSADVNWSSAYMIRDGSFMDADFHHLMEVGDRRTDVMLNDRDILYLPSNKDQKVFVLGEVGSPTIVPLYKERLLLVDALTQAGYVTSTAKKENVKVIRGGLNNPMMRSIDLEALEAGDARLNIPLQAGDIVYVPDSFIGKLNDVLVQITPSMNTLLQTLAIYTIGKTLGN